MEKSKGIINYTIGLLLLTMIAVNADTDIYCIDNHDLACPVGDVQDNVTLLNISTGVITNIETSQNALGMWNASYNFTEAGTYCARCDITNVSKCFNIVTYCQEEMQTNLSNVIYNQEGLYYLDIQTPEFWYSNNTVFFWVRINDFLGRPKDADTITAQLYYGNGSIANGSMDLGNSDVGEYNINFTVDSSPITGMYYLQINATIDSISNAKQKAFRITQSGPFQMIMNAQEIGCIGGKLAVNLSAFNEGEGSAETLFQCWIEDIYHNDTVYNLVSWYKQVGPKEEYSKEVEIMVPQLATGYYPAKCDYSIPNTGFEKMPPISDAFYLEECPAGPGGPGGTGYEEGEISRTEDVKRKVQYLRYKVYQAELEKLLFLLFAIPLLLLVYLERKRRQCKKCKKKRRVKGEMYCEACLKEKQQGKV